MKTHIYFVLLTFLFLNSCGSNTKPSPTTTNGKTKTNENTEASSTETVEKQNTPIEKNTELTTPEGCTYQNFQGLANVKSITAAPTDGENCPNAMIVEFEFQLINKREQKSYQYTLFKDESQFLTINDGLNPSSRWLSRVGIHKESTVRCIRRELIEGDCGKVLFEFPELDTNPKEKCI